MLSNKLAFPALLQLLQVRGSCCPLLGQDSVFLADFGHIKPGRLLVMGCWGLGCHFS